MQCQFSALKLNVEWTCVHHQSLKLQHSVRKLSLIHSFRLTLLWLHHTATQTKVLVIHSEHEIINSRNSITLLYCFYPKTQDPMHPENLNYHVFKIGDMRPNQHSCSLQTKHSKTYIFILTYRLPFYQWKCDKMQNLFQKCDHLSLSGCMFDYRKIWPKEPKQKDFLLSRHDLQ